MPINNPVIKPRILIVDDNPKNLQVLGKLLQVELFEMEFAINGDIALEWLDVERFDLILLDINMPGMNGFEVCVKIRSNPELDIMPVVFLTAQIDRESILKGFELGAQDYIIKPFDSRELLARVKTQLEIKSGRDKISRYLEVIKEKNKQITDSIEYALTIQNAVQNTIQKHSVCFKESFTLLLPKDIVSGDFYYFQKIENVILAGVFDGTGHGIPGAFISMLGISYLNEIVVKEGCYQPNIILGKIRERIINVLDQQEDILEVSNGMDGGLISYNVENKTLLYAGAFNSAYLARNGSLFELKGDRMSLSICRVMNDFTLQEISACDNDMVYLSSDGYTDQFGGPNDQKFGRSRYRNTLIISSKLSIYQQRQLLYDTYIIWQGDQEQIDDITIVGIRL